MRFQIADQDILAIERKSTQRYYLILGGVFISFFIIYAYILLIFNSPYSLGKVFQSPYTYLVALFAIILPAGAMLVGGLVSIMFAFTKPANMESELVKYIDFLDNSIEFTYFDGHTKKISYELLKGKTRANIGFTNALEEKTFNTLRDFFEHGVSFIEDTIKKHNKSVYPVIAILKNKSDKVFEVILSPYSLDLDEFFNEWFEKYSAYVGKGVVG